MRYLTPSQASAEMARLHRKAQSRITIVIDWPYTVVVALVVRLLHVIL